MDRRCPGMPPASGAWFCLPLHYTPFPFKSNHFYLKKSCPCKEQPSTAHLIFTQLSASKAGKEMELQP